MYEIIPFTVELKQFKIQTGVYDGILMFPRYL